MNVIAPSQSNAFPSVASDYPEDRVIHLADSSERSISDAEHFTPTDDGKRYVIAWQNQTRLGKGRGTTQFTRAEGEAQAKELNEQYPNIKHWVVLACALFMAVICFGCSEPTQPPPTPSLFCEAVTNVAKLHVNELAIVVVGRHRIAVIGGYKGLAICEVTDASLVKAAPLYVTNLVVFQVQTPGAP